MTSSCKQIDDSFGPHAGPCRGGFDFTLLFEESILSILPTLALLIVIPFRVNYLWKRQIKVNASIVGLVKPVSISIPAVAVHPSLATADT